jgi:hypothetical protein
MIQYQHAITARRALRTPTHSICNASALAQTYQAERSTTYPGQINTILLRWLHIKSNALSISRMPIFHSIVFTSSARLRYRGAMMPIRLISGISFDISIAWCFSLHAWCWHCTLSPIHNIYWALRWIHARIESHFISRYPLSPPIPLLGLVTTLLTVQRNFIIRLLSRQSHIMPHFDFIQRHRTEPITNTYRQSRTSSSQANFTPLESRHTVFLTLNYAYHIWKSISLLGHLLLRQHRPKQRTAQVDWAK